jgi:hypothetical protein
MKQKVESSNAGAARKLHLELSPDRGRMTGKPEVTPVNRATLPHTRLGGLAIVGGPAHPDYQAKLPLTPFQGIKIALASFYWRR